jgi:hypothetical protein
MADQIQWATDLLRPVWLLLIADVLASKVMHLDSTGLLVRDSERPGGTTVGSFWGYVGDTTSAVYLYTSTGKKLGQREGETGPEQFLARRTGYTVADAATVAWDGDHFSAIYASGAPVEPRRVACRTSPADPTATCTSSRSAT